MRRGEAPREMRTAISRPRTPPRAIRDVGAGDEQDETDRAEKNEKVDTEVHADHALVWKEVDARFLADVFGKFAMKILEDERVDGGKFGGCDSRLEACEDIDVVAAAHRFGDQRERRPNVGST